MIFMKELAPVVIDLNEENIEKIVEKIFSFSDDKKEAR